MGRDSQYYKDKKKQQTLKLRELISELPGFATDYLYDKEVSSQTSTLISYAYDLLTFFRYIKEMNPRFKDVAVKDFHLEDIERLTSEDIVEYQRYLELNDKGEKHENGKIRRSPGKCLHCVVCFSIVLSMDILKIIPWRW